MKWKKIIIPVAVGFLSVVIVTSFASAKFRGGSVIDVARVAKETQKVIEETKILSEITTLHDLQEEFFKVLDDLGQLENDVLTVVEEANILSNSVNGIIGAKNTYQAKVENLYSIDFLSNKYGNTPEAWKDNHKRLSEAYENEYKNSIDVAQKSEDISSKIGLQRDKILSDYSKGVISEKQKELMINYKGTTLNNGYRIDILVEDSIVLELKSVENLLPIHTAQILTYLKLSEHNLGLLINFNVTNLQNGIHRYII